jgi:asparagine synthase (glutamine-hydrolysing)
MCGIAGLVDCGTPDILDRMTAVQTHRGPDDAGVWQHRNADGTWAGLGSRRLAILDLSPAGHMPMVSADGRLCITYNGELYNSPDLRLELEAQGERFRSRSDTEVLLRLYAREGPGCLSRLNGMFAFAVYDMRKSRPELFIARDHFGIKPLYYATPGRGFAFASEMKSLLALPDVTRRIDARALERFLAFLWVPEPETILEDVHKLPPGHYGVFSAGSLCLSEYWRPAFPSREHRYPLNEEELRREVQRRTFDAVHRQLLSDVPVGAFLSAGLDSSTILAAMASSSSAPIRTYTITFPPGHRRGEGNLDDPAVAARTAAHFGADHHEIELRANAAELLPKLIWHMDEPVADPAIIAAYTICREARKDSTVLLSGTGGDEVFAGYRKYVANLTACRYRRLPALLRRQLIEPALQRLPPLRHTPFTATARWARKWARSASLLPIEQFIMDGTYLDEEMRGRLLNRPGSAAVGDPHRLAFSEAQAFDQLSQMQYADLKLFLPSLNLNYNDKMGMAASAEVRVPFLDRTLFEWVAANVPPALKIRGCTTKHILRRAMSGILPREVLHQPKASFGAPIGHWLEHDLREMTDDILSKDRIRARGWLQPDAVRTLIDEHRDGRQDWGMQIWQLLTLELWAQNFLDAPTA